MQPPGEDGRPVDRECSILARPDLVWGTFIKLYRSIHFERSGVSLFCSGVGKPWAYQNCSRDQ
jgi:hypothetical protein